MYTLGTTNKHNLIMNNKDTLNPKMPFLKSAFVFKLKILIQMLIVSFKILLELQSMVHI